MTMDRMMVGSLSAVEVQMDPLLVASVVAVVVVAAVHKDSWKEAAAEEEQHQTDLP